MSKPRIEGPTAVVFDVGNVLYGWDPESFLARQIPQDEARLRFIEDVDLWGWHDTLDAGRPFAEAAAELFERFAHAEAWQVFADAREALPTLRAAGLRLAVTSNFDARLPRLLADAGLAGFFDAVVYSEEVGVEKPHPAIFEELLERLELPAGDVLHVGDSRRDDVEGARAVGMQALWLTRRAPDRPGRGDLRSLRELDALLRLGVGKA